MSASPHHRFHSLFWISPSLAKYLSREILSSFFLGAAIFLTLMVLFQAVRLMEFLVIQQVGVLDTLRLFFHMTTSFIPLAIPISFLFAVVLGISRANSEGELIALQVGGIPLFQVFFPVFFFSSVIAAICLYLSLYSVPSANRKFELLVTKLGNQRAMANLKPGVFVDGFLGLTLLAEQIVPAKNEMKKLFIYDRRSPEHPVAITAKAGILRHNADRGVMTLRLSQGAIHPERAIPASMHQKIEFDVYDINLNVPSPGEGWREFSPPSYTYPVLQQKIREMHWNPGAQRTLEVELHRRFAMAFSCIVFGALGFFIGILSQKGVRTGAILICMGVGIGYWLSFVIGNAIAARGLLSAGVATWIPNFLFSVGAYYAWSRSPYRLGA